MMYDPCTYSDVSGSAITGDPMVLPGVQLHRGHLAWLDAPRPLRRPIDRGLRASRSARTFDSPRHMPVLERPRIKFSRATSNL